jgi:hypothetical protein
MSSEHDARATIEVLRPSAQPGDELPYRINNTGSVELLCGLAHSLELETDDGWVQMNPSMAFPAIGFRVFPNESRELRARIPANAPAGTYRLSTSVTSYHARDWFRLSASFEVPTAP